MKGYLVAVMFFITVISISGIAEGATTLVTQAVLPTPQEQSVKAIGMSIQPLIPPPAQPAIPVPGQPLTPPPAQLLIPGPAQPTV